MKKLKIFALFITSLIILSSCNNEDSPIVDEQQSVDQLYPEISKKLAAMYFNTNGLELINFELPDGTTQEMFQVEDDIIFSRKQIEEMEIGGDMNSKQYRTTNLVNDGTYEIIGFNITPEETRALKWAIYNYNRLNLDIHLTYGGSSLWDLFSTDIVVYQSNLDFDGGRAGFPSGGRPHKWIQINLGAFAGNTNVIEHVITHEIGHCFGMRHTDWWSRQSCSPSSQGYEGVTSHGATHIPGTPWGYDPTSLMLACFPLNSNGEFNSNDETALKYLY